MEVLQTLCTFIFYVPLSLADRVQEENPHWKYALVPVGCILTAAMAAWVVIPLLLKYYYNESIIFTEVTPWRPFPYEASYWGALEDPLRFLIGYFALSLAGYLIAPLTVENYVLPVWKGVAMASLVFFLHNCKRSAITQVLAVMEKTESDRKSLDTVDRLLSTAIFGLGLLALAAAVGVSMGYINLIMHCMILIIIVVLKI
ncbi:hypothetical protein Vadar_026618 [Vaccinium darrowii]|uniref:Uncharacterized protein n=1 Tax=Vaccinium darrowii TaxID=229202 RepID=A0ACB7Y386_9ERIC|nr:hypothetical protein Vadar_026618 [Vaccinium darrowii]